MRILLSFLLLFTLSAHAREMTMTYDPYAESGVTVFAECRPQGQTNFSPSGWAKDNAPIKWDQVLNVGDVIECRARASNAAGTSDPSVVVSFRLLETPSKVCAGDTAPPPPPSSYVVAPNGTRTDRPMYDGALWESTRDTTAQWKESGRIEVGQPCEAAVIRKTIVEYHYAINKAGKRDLTVCRLP